MKSKSEKHYFLITKRIQAISFNEAYKKEKEGEIVEITQVKEDPPKETIEPLGYNGV